MEGIKMGRLTTIIINLIVISLTLTGISDAKIEPESILGMWLFDEGKGDTAKEAFTKKNDGTLENGPKWVKGKFGTALEFDGVDDHVLVSNFNLPEDNWSISSWVKRGNLGGIWISHNKTRTANNNLHLFFRGGNNGKPEIDYYNNALVANNIVDEGDWAHIVFVVESNSNRKVYINAVLDNTDKNGVKYTGGAAPLYIGIFFDCCRFKGLIDEVAIFNVALTEDDIKSLMTNGLKPIAAVSAAGKLATTWGRIKTK
jgi:hypothetical protein